MGYSWSILEAAVEQYIMFPTEQAYRQHISSLAASGKTYEVIWKHSHECGTVTAVIRKQYNQCEFLSVLGEGST